MKRLVLIILFACVAGTFAANPKTDPKPQALPKGPLPKVAVLVSFNGFADFYDFAASDENYQLSALYQSLTYFLESYTSNLTIVDSGKMLYIPLGSGEDKKAIDLLGVNYLIKINMNKTGGASSIHIGSLNSGAVWLTSDWVMLQGKLNPEFLGKMNAVFEKNLSAILNDIARQKMIEENKGKIFINLTNTQYKTVTNKISVNDTFLGVLVVNKLIINGNFQYLENVNSFNTVYYTNESMKFHSGYAVDLYPGLNFLRFGMYNGYFTKNSWDYFNEKLFVINNISLKNTNLNLDEFSIAPVSHILFGWGFKMYLPTGNYFLNFDFGFRFAIGKSSKIRIVLNICDLRDYNYYNGNWNVYNYPNAAFKVGFESKIGERMNQFDYMYAWFADGYYAGDHIGIDGGISVRLDPLFSINLGLDISYFFARKHSDWYYDALYHYVSVSLDKPGEFDFAFFLQYEFFVPISHNYKNYEFDY